MSVNRHRRAKHPDVRIAPGQPSVQSRPTLAPVLRAPDRGAPFGHTAAVPGVERDHEERLAVVWVRGGGEAKLARKALGDLEPGVATVVAAVNTHVILLIEALMIDRRAHHPVNAESDLLVRSWPVARNPRLRGVQDAPPSRVSKRPIPCTIDQKCRSSTGSLRIAERPRCPGGCVAGSSQLSLPGCPARVRAATSFHRRPGSRTAPGPRRQRAHGHGQPRASRAARPCGLSSRRSRAPCSRAASSHRGRDFARPLRHAIRSQRRRRSCPCRCRVRRDRPASFRRTDRAPATRHGPSHSRRGTAPCVFRPSALSVSSRAPVAEGATEDGNWPGRRSSWR